MEPMTISETIALGMLAIATVSLVSGVWRRSRREAAAQQVISDQMRNVVEGLAEVRKVLTDLRDDFSTHGQQLAAIQMQVDGLEKRVSRVEDRCDAHVSMGGTE